MKTGVIGLGAMGAGMARNFSAAGILHTVWNRTASKAEAIAGENGITAAESPATLAAECELIVICVSRDEDVIEMAEVIASKINKDAIVVDTSTVSADTAKKCAEIISSQGAHFLDCPVSGGVEGAQKGTLAMMVGGDNSVLERARESLSAIAAKIIYIGSTGSGQACKAVNQIMCAGINQAVTEALAFGQAMQLDMDKVIDVVSTGAAGNWFLDHRGKTMLKDDYVKGFKLNLHLKDLQICKQMSDKVKELDLTLVDMTIEAYDRLIKMGHGDEDISALFRLKRCN